MKSGFLTVSFGSTHLDTLERAVAAPENALKAAFPQARHYRALTSGIVRGRLKSRYGVQADSVEEALERMKADGIRQAVIQPTLLIPGEEYDRLRVKLLANCGGMEISIGLPLLWDDTDLCAAADLLEKTYPMGSDSVLVAMGHGTRHPCGCLYTRLAERMEKKGMVFCTAEGSPSFEDALQALQGQPRRKVHLASLLLAAGEHSKNDMAGKRPDSLRGRLEQNGFAVSWTLQGLGELPAIQKAFVRRAAAAYEALGKRAAV